MTIAALYISPGHNYFGHFGQAPGSHPLHEVREVECVAGKGLCGDRFFGYKENYQGQVTFFDHAVYRELCETFAVWDKPPAVFRRNVITVGTDLNSLIGRPFEIQGICFEGAAECSPCLWMDEAFCPGTEDFLKGRGGLRARILSDGVLRRAA